MVRHFKPQCIIEIGSGSSTLMVRNAIARNKSDNPQYRCRHMCIEPYEQPWLEKTEVELIRDKVENVDKSFFQQLGPNDILFIDSSHIIRPQGDVLFEYLELLPTLASGVLVFTTFLHRKITSTNGYTDTYYGTNSIYWRRF